MRDHADFPQDREIERLRAVYAGYRSDEERLHAWSDANHGNRMITEERSMRLSSIMDRLVQEHGRDLRVLDLGCGSGHVLAEVAKGRIPGMNCHGVDLVMERLKTASDRHHDMHFICARGDRLPYPSASFDVALLFTVLSSIPDRDIQCRIGQEIGRVLSDRGVVVWYDMRWMNPGNSNIVAMNMSHIRRCFPAFDLHLSSITLAPPVDRHLGPATRYMYPLLARVPFLRSHYIGYLQRSS